MDISFSNIDYGSIDGFVLVMWIVAMLTGVAATVLWEYRKRTGGISMTLMLLFLCVWNLFAGFEHITINLPGKIFWMRFAFIGISGVPSTALLSTRILSAKEQRWHPALRFVLAAIPLINVVLVFTNPSHHLVWTGFHLNAVNGIAMYEHGPWFNFIWTPFSYVVMFVTILLIMRAVGHHKGVLRTHALGALVAVIPPGLANLSYLLSWDMGLLQNFDFTPIVFGAAGLMMGINHRFIHVLQNIPVAADQVLSNMNQGVLVVGEHDTILDVNPAMCHMFGLEEQKMIGQSVHKVFGRWEHALQLLYDAPGRLVETDVADVGYLEFHISKLQRRDVESSGWIVLVTDITARKQAEQGLREAQNTIKTLGELVPICAWCGRRIQQEDGTWIEVDQFIEEHSHSEMTHGICPVCHEKHLKV